MNCNQFEEQLNEALDQRVALDWNDLARLPHELSQHVAHCSACRDLATLYGLISETVQTLPTVQPSADLAARVLADLEAHPLDIDSQRGGSLRPVLALSSAWIGGLASIAAAVLVAFFLTTGPQTSELVAQATTPRPVAEAPLADSQLADSQLAASNTNHSSTNSEAPLLDKAQLDLNRWKQVPLVGPALFAMADNDETTDPYAELAKGTGRGLAQLVLLMPSISSPRGISPAAINSLNGMGNWLPSDVGNELRPVTDTMSETFNLLLDVLPITFSSNTPVQSRAS